MRNEREDGETMKMNTTNPQWVIMVAICLLMLIGLLLAGTIVLALIPVYLAQKTPNLNTEQSVLTLSPLYASDAIDGRSLILADTGALSDQFSAETGLGSSGLKLVFGDFLDLTAAARKKRQVITGNTVNCERPTNLGGDVFATQFSIPYPPNCFGFSCRRRFLNQVQNALRLNYRTFTVQMTFTTGEVRNVRLTFCSFLDVDANGCTVETRSNIYAIGRNATLYTVDPTNYRLSNLGSLNCSDFGRIYSIGVQRSGILWILLTNGNLHRYYIRVGQCRPTAFVPFGNDISLFSMTFLKSSIGNEETLYVSKQNDPPNTLGILDLSTLNITAVNNYSNLSTYAELAATRTSRLYGLFEVNPYTVAEIDPNNANILSQHPLGISRPESGSNYAFASYNEQFFFFEGNGTYTEVHLVDLPSNRTENVLQYSQPLYSATASSCLGT